MTEKHRCHARVYYGDWGRSHQCSRNGGIERHGAWYCKTHDPIATADKNATRKKQFDESWDRRMSVNRLHGAASEMLELLVESQSGIGGDWRERRDAIISKLQEVK